MANAEWSFEENVSLVNTAVLPNPESLVQLWEEAHADHMNEPSGQL